MSQAVPERFATACSHCGKRFAASRANLGKQCRCSSCGEVFVIKPAPAPTAKPAGPAVATPPPPRPTAAAAQTTARPAPPSPRPTPPPSSSTVCAVCQSPCGPGEATTTCPDCGGVFHAECWEYNKGCALYGCSQAPPTEGLSSLEVPAAYWGREEKPCPSCGTSIAAAAVRCRHCGAMFSSAAPKDAGTYRAEMRAKGGLPGVRKATVWLLVLSLIPCTAPLAAIGGPIWYAAKRETIRQLPPLNQALCKIAVGVAVVQTGLFLVFGTLAGILNR